MALSAARTRCMPGGTSCQLSCSSVMNSLSDSEHSLSRMWIFGRSPLETKRSCSFLQALRIDVGEALHLFEESHGFGLLWVVAQSQSDNLTGALPRESRWMLHLRSFLNALQCFFLGKLQSKNSGEICDFIAFHLCTTFQLDLSRLHLITVVFVGNSKQMGVCEHRNATCDF